MGLRLRRSLKLMPGLRLNFGLGGLSLSAGPRGASVNLGTRGLFGNVGLPGTGISFRQRLDGGTRRTDDRSLSSVQVKLQLDETGRLELYGSDGLPLEPRIERQIRRLNEPQLREWLEQRCREIDDGIEAITNIHLSTPDPQSQAVFRPAPFAEPEPEAPASPRFGFWDRTLPWLKSKKERSHQYAVESFAREVAQWKSRRETHDRQAALESQRHADLLRSHLPVIEQSLEDALGSIAWPRETSVDFAFNETGKRLVLEVDLPEVEVMPTRDAAIAARGLKLNIRTRSDAQIRRAYAAHVHAVVFRVIGAAFAALPALEEMVCSGYSQRPDRKTAALKEEYLLSVLVRRAEWRQIDFMRLNDIDVIASVERFHLVRDLSSGGRFSPIEPLELLTAKSATSTTNEDRP